MRAHFVVAFFALALAGCKTEKPKEADPVIPVQVEDVKAGSIQRLVVTEGIIHPKDQANLAR